MKVLYNGHKELEGRLVREIERAAGRKALFSINVRSSDDTLRFLKGLFKAINNCTITYWNYTDYFVAGKLLDKAKCLLKDSTGSSVVPYFIESVREQKPHPLLGPIYTDSRRAILHLMRKILTFRPCVPKSPQSMRFKQDQLELRKLKKQNEKKIKKTDLLENLRRKIDCGNAMSQELLKMIFELNEKLMGLIERAKKADEEMERVINGKVLLDKCGTDCLYQLPLGETKMKGVSGKKRINLATLPSSCIRQIVSYFNCDKMAQMRAVCKSFNEVCKNRLNQECEELNQILQFKISYLAKENERLAGLFKEDLVEINIFKDLRCFLRLCKDNYKSHLGSGYYFAAGRVLDEAKRISNEVSTFYEIFDNDYFDLVFDYESQPHFILFPLMDMAYTGKSIAHFKFTIVPEFFPSTRKSTRVPDGIINSEMTNLEKESHSNLENLEKIVEETEEKIKEQNVRNRKLHKIVFGLKKKIFVLKEKISKTINVLKELE